MCTFLIHHKNKASCPHVLSEGLCLHVFFASKAQGALYLANALQISSKPHLVLKPGERHIHHTGHVHILNHGSMFSTSYQKRSRMPGRWLWEKLAFVITAVEHLRKGLCFIRCRAFRVLYIRDVGRRLAALLYRETSSSAVMPGVLLYYVYKGARQLFPGIILNFTFVRETERESLIRPPFFPFLQS